MTECCARLVRSAARILPLLVCPVLVSAAAPDFEVASIKLCRADIPDNVRTGAGIQSPTLLDIECQSVRGLIQMAYVGFASGLRMTPVRIPIEGGPAWLDSERYSVQAKTDGTPSQVMMHGPMLQRLLEDRLRLRIHRETREIPVYALTVAKGGPKLQPFHEGTCNVYDISASFPPPPPPENPCHNRGGLRGGVLAIDVQAATLDDIAMFYLGGLDRPIVDKTGISGRFDFHLEYVPDSKTGDADPSGPSIFTAVQEQLDLKLEPAKGPGEFVVIDHVEKPSAN